MRSAIRSAAIALATLLLLLPGPAFLRAGPERTSNDEKKVDKSGHELGAVEVRFIDSSSLKLTLKDERIDLATPYGKLRIPVADIQRIEFASRIPEEMLNRIESAIGALGSGEHALRDKATLELRKLGERAYPALLVAVESKDPEVVRRVEKLLERIRDEVPEDQLVFRKHDVVWTADSKSSGQIEGGMLKAQTFQFGEVRLKIADLRMLQSLAIEPESDTKTALANPGHLHNYAGQFNKEFRFRVTGLNDNGGLWGSDVYTLDSSLAKAAVHAGVLKVGQTGIVKVRIIPSPPAFAGANRNGIVSGGYGPYPGGAFQIVK
jgi:hypothetical protein